MLLERQPSRVKPQLDIPGVLLVSSGLFFLVYGFSNAAMDSWHSPSTYGSSSPAWRCWPRSRSAARAASPLLPPRIVLGRNRGGAYLSMLIASSAMFGTFLFLTYYLQQTVGYAPIVMASPSCRSSAASRSRPTCPTSCSCPNSGLSRWSRSGC